MESSTVLPATPRNLERINTAPTSIMTCAVGREKLTNSRRRPSSDAASISKGTLRTLASRERTGTSESSHSSSPPRRPFPPLLSSHRRPNAPNNRNQRRDQRKENSTKRDHRRRRTRNPRLLRCKKRLSSGMPLLTPLTPLAFPQQQQRRSLRTGTSPRLRRSWLRQEGDQAAALRWHLCCPLR